MMRYYFVFSALLACSSLSSTSATTSSYSTSKLIEMTRSSTPYFLDKTNPRDLSIDCAWRLFSFNYTTSLQPWLTPSQLHDIFDGLEIVGNGCGNASYFDAVVAATRDSGSGGNTGMPTSKDTATISAQRALESRKSTLSSTPNSIYVDYTNGNDSNSGNVASAPLKTIAAAIVMARTEFPPFSTTIYLRNGTHYLVNGTLNLTPQDSGLSIVAYQNETPVISGTIPVPPSSLTWTSYKKTNPYWGAVLNDTNNVFGQCGDSPTVPNKGVMADWQECQASCFNDPLKSCTGWTMNGGEYGPFANICCWRTDGVWAPVAEANITSQTLYTGINIWKTQLPSNLLPPTIPNSSSVNSKHILSFTPSSAEYLGIPTVTSSKKKLSLGTEASEHHQRKKRESMEGYQLPSHSPFSFPSSSTGIPALRINNHRATLARFPNANPEIDIFPVGYISSGFSWIAPLAPSGDAGPKADPVANYTYTYELPDNMRDPASGIYINYTIGYGGNANRYFPPRSFWASSDFGPQNWMTTTVCDRWVEMHLRSPSGISFDANTTLPLFPTYSNFSQIKINTWRQSHWYSWFFSVGEVINNATTNGFLFNGGGTQGGEGCDEAAEFYIDGVLEELDAPNEYFYHPTTNTLYLYPNATDQNATDNGSPTGAFLEIPSLNTFFSLYGSEENPITNISFVGLTFTGGSPTTFEPRAVPSGGDWAIDVLGAILAKGSEDILVHGCTFTRLDGNAIFLSGYNRRAVISQNECVWLGQSCIASYGDSNEWDGTGGEQPRHSLIYGNLVHEIGILQKQSSFYFQAVSCENTIANNIVYNIPRAAININDGFGGGNNVSYNLFWNTCRESSDHSTMNSWSRLPYVTTVGDGITPSAIPGYNVLKKNFVVNNYGADGGLYDTDDGSSYFIFDSNVGWFSGHKSDFDGHSKHSFNNLHIYPQIYGPRCLQIGAQFLPGFGGRNTTSGGYLPYVPGAADSYVNNTCILANSGENVVSLDVGDAVLPVIAEFHDRLFLSNNTIYSVDAVAPGYEGPNGNDGTKYSTYAEFQAAGYDVGSVVVNQVPTAEQILEWAKELLFN